MTVIFSPDAEADLESIGDYIARSNPQRARSFVAELRSRCLLIADSPLGGAPRDDIFPDLRMVVIRRYLILYIPSGSDIRIERVLYGARDLKKAF